jgi:sulfopyruvate decarboxylase alpha subunit
VERLLAAAIRVWAWTEAQAKKHGPEAATPRGSSRRRRHGSIPDPSGHCLLPVFFVTSLIAWQWAPWHRQSLQITVTARHVDNPAVDVKFRRSKGVANEKSSRVRENKMAVAEERTSPETSDKTWHGVVLQTLKRNDIRLVPYVPDRVLTTLIRNLHADPFFTTFPTAREEEAVGIVSGAWMGGMRGAVLMQTSGFATLANILASLAIPYQIPLIMFVSERGTLGEFNYGQSLVCRTMRPVLDSLAMEHHTATRLDEFEFIVDRSIKQAVTTQAPVALILSPLLTGGKVFDK